MTVQALNEAGWHCPDCGAEWPTFGQFEGSWRFSCESCGWTDAPVIETKEGER